LVVSIFHVTEFPFIVLAFRDLSSLRTHFRPFTEVMRKSRREVTRKNPEDRRTRLRRRYGVAGRGLRGCHGLEQPEKQRTTRMQRMDLLQASAAADALQLSSDLQQRGRALPDLSE
jgi:hypothetical protein